MVGAARGICMTALVAGYFLTLSKNGLSGESVLMTNTTGNKILPKTLALFFALAVILAASGCSKRTPEIRGMVIDAETKKPVPNAWVMVTLNAFGEGLAGGSYSTLSLSLPHTRTKEDGSFVVPSKKFGGLFVKPSELRMLVFAMDGRKAELRIEKKELHEFMPLLWGKRELAVQVTEANQDEEVDFNELESLWNYCEYGRYGVEQPIVTEGCDAWELDYVVYRFEKYLKKNIEEVVREEKDRAAIINNAKLFSHVLISIDRLGGLYKKKSETAKAVAIYKEGLKMLETAATDKKSYIYGLKVKFDSDIRLMEKN